jgi:hypothetical protein
MIWSGVRGARKRNDETERILEESVSDRPGLDEPAAFRKEDDDGEIPGKKAGTKTQG